MTSLIVMVLFFIPTNVEAAPRNQASLVRDFQCPEKFGHILAAANLPKRPSILKPRSDVSLAGKIMDLRQLRKYAVRIEPGAEIPHGLPDQTYAYVVDAAGNIAMMPRVVDPGIKVLPSVDAIDATFIGSHLGLIRILENSPSAQAIAGTGKIVSAGEFVVRNGRVLAVSNGSGTLYPKPAHLEYGLQKLKSAGLRVDERTQILDFSSQELLKLHYSVADQARIEIQALRNPKFVKLLARAREVFRNVDQKFPSSSALINTAMNAAKDAAEQSRSFQAVSFFEQCQEPRESAIVYLKEFADRVGEEKVLRILDTLEHL